MKILSAFDSHLELLEMLGMGCYYVTLLSCIAAVWDLEDSLQIAFYRVDVAFVCTGCSEGC